MKQKYFVGVIIFFLFSATIYGIFSKLNFKLQTERKISEMPNFEFFTLADAPYTADSLKPAQPTMFLYYNSTCDHCQYEIEQLLLNSNKLLNCNVLLISSQSSKEIKLFDSTYSLNKYAAIKLLKDKTNNFYQTFGIDVTPSSVIYNKTGFLKGKYEGEIKIETILKNLQ